MECIPECTVNAAIRRIDFIGGLADFPIRDGESDVPIDLLRRPFCAGLLLTIPLRSTWTLCTVFPSNLTRPSMRDLLLYHSAYKVFALNFSFFSLFKT